MRIVRVVAVPLFLALNVHAQSEASRPSVSQHTKPTVAITVSTQTNVVRLGSEVRVQVTRTNISDQDVIVSDPANTSEEIGLDFEMELRDKEGLAVAKSQYGLAAGGSQRAIHGPAIGKVSGAVPRSLKAGEKVQQEIILTKYFEITQPGRYTIQLVRIDQATKAIVKSNRITLTVIP